MKPKQFLTLIVLGLVVGGLGWYFYGKRKESFTTTSFAPGEKVLPNLPINEIGRVRIKQSTNEVNLVKGDVWTVEERWGYPANYTDLAEFLRKMAELKPVQDVEVGPSQYARLELNSPAQEGAGAGTLVEFKDAKNAEMKSVILGKKVSREAPAGPFGGGGEFPVGRYITVPGQSPAKVWLVNETFANIETQPEQWLNKDFIKVEKVKAVSVTYPEETNSWAVVRESEGGEWKLQAAKPSENFDPAKASSLNYAFSSPSFNDVAAPELKPEESGLAQPTVARLETFDGFIYTLNVSSKTTPDDNYYLKIAVDAKLPESRTAPADEKPEDKERLDKEFTEKLEKLREKLKNEEQFEKWTYLVSKWTVDSLLKKRGDFMSEKKEEEAPATPAASPNTPPIDVLPPELKNLPVLPQPPTPTKTEAQPAEKPAAEPPNQAAADPAAEPAPQPEPAPAKTEP